MKLVCIPALKSHLQYVNYSLELLLKKFPNADYVNVTPDLKIYSHLRKRNVSIKGDDEYWDLSPSDLKSKLSYQKKDLYKWYYQQFLKYSIITKSTKYNEILIVDADTVILSDCVLDTSSINFTLLEYNKSYFEIIDKFFPHNTRLPKSTIVNFMWFNQALFRNMLSTLSKNSKNQWFNVLLDDINKNNSDYAFSEYETYANYKFNILKAGFKTLRVFRRGDLFMHIYSLEKTIALANFFKLDLISFENHHKTSIVKLLSVMPIVMVYEIKSITDKICMLNLYALSLIVMITAIIFLILFYVV